MIPNSRIRFSLSKPSAPVRSIARFRVILVANCSNESENGPRLGGFDWVV